MRKRVLSLLMTLLLCFSMLPTAVSAAEDEAAQSVDALASTEHAHKYCGSTECDHDNEGSIKIAASISNAVELQAADSGSYYLTDDIELSGTWRPKDGTVLCLNGKTIRANSTDEVICVEQGRTFTLLDCQGTGKITHGSKNGQGVTVAGTFYMYGGTIRGCDGVKANRENAGGVEVTSSGRFEMLGGKITRNNNVYVSGDSQFVGGVYVAGRIMLSRGAEITDNRNGDIYLCSGAKINIGEGGLTGSSESKVNLQDYPSKDGESVEIGYSPDTDASGHFEAYTSDCVISDVSNGADHVLLLTKKSGWLKVTASSTALKLAQGETAALSVSAEYKEGTVAVDHLGYQWYENTKAGDTPIDGATDATFNVPTDLEPGTYYYYCRAYAYNAAGGWLTNSGYSSRITVTVLGNLTVRKGADVMQPYGTENGKVSLDISGEEGYTLSYQWYEEVDPNEINSRRLIPGATSAEYPIPADTPVGTYYYYCVVKAQELTDIFTTTSSKVTITQGKVTQGDIIKSITVYFNTAATYTCDLKDCLPDGVVLSSASYTIDGDIYCDSDWIDGGVQLTGSVLTFNSKSASDPDDIDILRLTIKVTSANYEGFYIQLTGQASTKREENLAVSDVRWTYGDTPKDPRDFVSGAPSDAVWVRTTYTDKWGNAIEAPTSATNAGEYRYKVEYETLSTHYVGEGPLNIEAILVEKSRIDITNTHTTYDGTTKYVEEIIKVTVEVNGKKITLSPNDFYVGNGPTAAASASANPKRVTFKLQGNYNIFTGDEIQFDWYIDPLEAQLELVNGTDRKYGDGKGIVTLKVANAPEFDTVTVACNGGDDLSVGDHTITATGLLKADGTTDTNYKLGEGDSKRTLTYHVDKADAPASQNLTMDVYNNLAKTYTYDFSQALPALADGLTFGNCTYKGEPNVTTNVVSGIGFHGSVLTFRTGRISSREGTMILSYTATVTSDNYKDFRLILRVHTKDKKAVPVQEDDITMAGWTYGQTPTTPSVAGLPAGVTPTFTYQDETGTDITPTYTTDAGAYTVTVRAETDDIVYIGTKPFTVAPKTLTEADIREYGPISPNKVYDGNTGFDLTGLGTKKTSLVGTPGANDVLYIGGTAKFSSANAGDTKLIFTTNGKLSTFPGGAVKPGNYTIAKGLTKPFKAKIDQRWLDFTVDSVSKPHGSPDSAADVRVTFTGVTDNSESGLVDGEQLVQGVDYDVTATFSKTTIGDDDGVVVTVTLKDTPAAKNYRLVSGKTITTGEIKKAAAPNVPEQTIEIYSNAETRYPIDLKKGWPAGTPSIFDYTYDGRYDPELNAGEFSELLYQSASFTCPAPDDWNRTGTIYLNINRAFTADVGADLGVLKLTFKSPNYDDVTLCIRFKVKAKAQKTLAVNLEGWRYGETANPPAYTVPASATETTLTYTSRDGQTSYGATPPTDAGDYTLTVRCEGIDTIWTGSEDFTIARKPIAPPAADTTSFTYTSSAQTYTLASNAAYTISPNTTQTNAGSYTITVSLNDTANTEWTDGTMAAKEYTFTISAAKLTVTALDKRITAGQSAPDLTTPVLGEDYKVDGLLGQDALTAVTLTYGETPDTRKAGSYAINISAVQTNYDITTVPGTLTVAPRPSSGGGSTTYPVNTPSKTENGSVSVSPKNASRGDTVTITVKPDDGYVLDDLTVTDKNGNDLKLTDKGNGKYTFTMPAGKVEVKASFAEEAETSPFADVATDAYYYEAVKWAAEQGITGGIGNNLFGPNQPCTRAQIVTFLWRAAGSPEPKDMSSFADVSTDSYYAKAVAWAVENGITSGTGDGKFSPDATCTRAQAVTFLARALNAKATSAAEFSDVPTDSYFAEAVAWAASNGVTAGIGGGLFGPNNDCTRAQIVTFLFRAYNK